MQKVKLNAPWCHKVVCSHLGKVKQVSTRLLLILNIITQGLYPLKSVIMSGCDNVSCYIYD